MQSGAGQDFSQELVETKAELHGVNIGLPGYQMDANTTDANIVVLDVMIGQTVPS